MRLQPETEHPHGLSDGEFDALFTTDRPVIFAYHGYPWLIHRLTYRRTNHANLHVRGYKEEGTTTTPFDMVMLNDLDRFHLVMDVIDRVPGLGRAGRPRCASRWSTSALERRALHARARRGRRPEVPRLDAGRAERRRGDACGSSSSTPARAASSSRVLDADDRSSARRDLPATRGRGRRGGARARRSQRLGAVDAVGHRVVHGGDRLHASRSSSTTQVVARLRGADRPRAAPPAEVAGRARRRSRRSLPGRAGGRLLRHRVPRRHAGGRGDLRAAARVARRAGTSAASASTASRTPTRRAGRPSSLGRAGRGAADRDLPPRRRRLAGRGRAAAARSTRRWASRRSRGW